MISLALLTVGDITTTQVSERSCLSRRLLSEPVFADRAVSRTVSASVSKKTVCCTPIEWSFQTRWPLFWPLMVTIAITLLIRSFDLDHTVSSFFFDSDNMRWPLKGVQPWKMIYRKGPWLGMGLGIGSLIIAVLGRWLLPVPKWSQSKSLFRSCVFLSLVLILGPGVLINTVLKPYWGRPRPIHCVEYGGHMAFVPVGTPANAHLPNSSFPCGHASIAFYLMTPGFVFGKRNRVLSYGFFFLGTAFGVMMGMIRIVQGAHFASDVIWSGLLVYLVGALLARVVLVNSPKDCQVSA